MTEQPDWPSGTIRLDDAQLLDPPGQQSLRIRFGGLFEGRQVTWNATLHALGRPRGVQAGTGGNFIEVGSDSPEGIRLTIGLTVERVDLPTVRNTLIMIRRYKGLRRGRHEW